MSVNADVGSRGIVSQCYKQKLKIDKVFLMKHRGPRESSEA